MTKEQRERFEQIEEQAVEDYLDCSDFNVEEWVNNEDREEYLELKELYWKQPGV